MRPISSTPDSGPARHPFRHRAPARQRHRGRRASSRLPWPPLHPVGRDWPTCVGEVAARCSRAPSTARLPVDTYVHGPGTRSRAAASTRMHRRRPWRRARARNRPRPFGPSSDECRAPLEGENATLDAPGGWRADLAIGLIWGLTADLRSVLLPPCSVQNVHRMNAITTDRSIVGPPSALARTPRPRGPTEFAERGGPFGVPQSPVSVS